MSVFTLPVSTTSKTSSSSNRCPMVSNWKPCVSVGMIRHRIIFHGLQVRMERRGARVGPTGCLMTVEALEVCSGPLSPCGASLVIFSICRSPVTTLPPSLEASIGRCTWHVLEGGAAVHLTLSGSCQGETPTLLPRSHLDLTSRQPHYRHVTSRNTKYRRIGGRP